MIRTVLVALTLLLVTPLLAGTVAIAAALGIPNRTGGLYDWCARTWARLLVVAGGVRVRMHGTQNIGDGAPRVFVSNHVSWYDVFVLGSELPKYRFVAKAELFRIPIFGAGARAVGTIPIERSNRSSAFQSYETAGKLIREGNPVVVFPEGTRGSSYPLRPFKKGPFVLAIASGVPIVPTIVYGAIEVMSRRGLRVHPGIVDVHFLEPVPTVGLTYDDRDRLAREVYSRMAAAMYELHGVESPALPVQSERHQPIAPPASKLHPSRA